MDSADRGSPDDDIITNLDDQLRIGRMLDSTVDSLKSITCTYSDCSAINQTATNQTEIRSQIILSKIGSV